MTIVLADDVTGAAEVAGIAWQKGLRTVLTVGAEEAPASVDVWVIATDSRSMSEADASQTVAAVCRNIREKVADGVIFKKTDSAMRGHVTAECRAVMSATGRRGALWLPGNPTHGRIVKEGVYYINGQRLDKTDFSFDPGFPAYSAVVTERFPDVKTFSGEWQAGQVYFADVTSQEDIRRSLAALPDGILTAGAADVFTVWLEQHAPATQQTPNTSRSSFHVPRSSLLVCGSTQSKTPDTGIPVWPVPQEVYDGKAPASVWTQRVLPEYIREGRGALVLDAGDHQTPDKRKGNGRRRKSPVVLQDVMADVVKSLVDARRPEWLVVEGGATAFAVISRLGWKTFSVERLFAPGVILLGSDSGDYLLLKPGSYRWS